MAEKGFILSAEEELKLREPIDEYIGKIQEQIDALRLDGTDKVRSLKNHIAVVKESKNLSKEEKTKIIENDKKVLEEVIYSISYSVKDNYDIDVINFFVNNEKIKY